MSENASKFAGGTPLELRLRPELKAGGFTRRSGTLEFFIRIRSLVSPTSVILDLGAGRGALADLPLDNFAMQIPRLKGTVRSVLGADVDPVVLDNPLLDKAYFLEAGKPLPFTDDYFDLIYADWVLEHIADPVAFVGELHRTIRPGGWFCARTPNKWGYVAIAARMVSPGLERRILGFLQPGRKESDVFPKFYRMNTLQEIRRLFSSATWSDCSYMFESEPAYHGDRAMLYKLFETYEALCPDILKSGIFVFMQKRRA